MERQEKHRAEKALEDLSKEWQEREQQLLMQVQTLSEAVCQASHEIDNLREQAYLAERRPVSLDEVGLEMKGLKGLEINACDGSDAREPTMSSLSDELKEYADRVWGSPMK